MEINYAIRWIEIYPLDSAIQRLNNRGQDSRKKRIAKRLSVIGVREL